MSTLATPPGLINDLKALVGSAYILTNQIKMQPYSKGFRFGSGSAVAVVRPSSLLEIWQALQICVDADVAVLLVP